MTYEEHEKIHEKLADGIVRAVERRALDSPQTTIRLTETSFAPEPGIISLARTKLRALGFGGLAVERNLGGFTVVAHGNPHGDKNRFQRVSQYIYELHWLASSALQNDEEFLMELVSEFSLFGNDILSIVNGLRELGWHIKYHYDHDKTNVLKIEFRRQ